MPLYKEWNIGAHGLAAIWKIEEPESFFRERTGMDTDIKNEKRRTEHLAGRFLLKHLENDFPLVHIGIDEHDKPRLDGNRFYFSISHSWPYVAAVIDTHNEAGIDIQVWHKDISRIQYKFLSPAEQELIGGNEQHITIAWCAKEAAYKWNGKRGVDFIKDLPIDFFKDSGENHEMMIYFKLSEIPQILQLESMIDTDFACSYIVKAQNWVIY